MIVIAGDIHLDPKDREAAIKAALEMMAASAKENGCIHYRFYADLEDPGRLHVYEEWQSPAALEAHGKSPHMAKWRSVLAGLTVRARAIKKFEAGPATEL
jgi:quinol monooxygenase YgiN